MIMNNDYGHGTFNRYLVGMGLDFSLYYTYLTCDSACYKHTLV